MAIKTIEYKVNIAGITPATEQFGGTQGDHRVTQLNYELMSELYDGVESAKGDGKAMYRFDVHDGEGGIWQSEPKELEKNVQLVLEEQHTRHGGKITVYLVVTVLSEENQTEMELYSFPCVLRLKSRPDGEYQYGESYESVSALVTQAESSAVEAREFADEVIEKLKNGEFDGKDGISATHEWNGTVLTIESASGKTSADLKGEKGDKGDMPDVSGFVLKSQGNTHTDQVYAVDSIGQQKMLDVEDNWYFENERSYGDIPRRKSNGNIMTNTPVDNLDCANKKYVDDLVSNLSGLKLVVVSTLPNIGAADTLYFVPSTLTLDQNLYDEYIYTNGSWEKIGSAAVEVNLTDYVKKTDYATSDKPGLVMASGTYALSVNTLGGLLCAVYTLKEYNKKNDSAFVSKGTLNNVLAEKLGDIETLLGGI